MQRVVATAGTIAAALGAGLLFFFGPPDAQRPGAATWLGRITAEDVRRSRRWTVFSWCGLALGVAGAAAEIAAIWM